MSVPLPNPLRRRAAPRLAAATLDREQTTRVSIRVRPQDGEGKRQELESLLGELATRAPHRREHLSAEEWEGRFGARQKDLDRVAAFAKRKGLRVASLDAGRRTVTLEGSLDRLEAALGVELHSEEDGAKTVRTHDGPVLVPKSLADTIESVHGLEKVPAPHALRLRLAEPTEAAFTVRRVAELYDFPLEYTGKGQTAVLLLLGGGFHQEDLDRYFKVIGLATPRIDVVELDGAKNRPASNEAIQRQLKAQGMDPRPVEKSSVEVAADDTPTNVAWTVETTTDIEILGALAPEARLVVVFAPNTQDDQASAMETILGSDFETRYGRPTVISCSWGQYEYRMKSSPMAAMESALARAATMGVTVCFASGDYGGGPVYYPASSIYALACGGTAIEGHPRTAPVTERVWREERMSLYFSASGGGASETFAAPEWQQAAVAAWGGRLRGIPDLAAQASLERGYALIIGGAEVSMGGTSSAAPLMAGLVVQITEANRDLKPDYRVGWLTPLIYGKGFRDAFVAITSGDNGLFMATSGWDPCTGLGRPVGRKLLEALRALA